MDHTMIWIMLHPNATPEPLGFIPTFLDEADPRPAREQFQANYAFGGWNPFHGFALTDSGALKYPGDPPLPPLAETRLRNEIVRVYSHAWVTITKPDGAWEVARMD